MSEFGDNTPQQALLDAVRLVQHDFDLDTSKTMILLNQIEGHIMDPYGVKSEHIREIVKFDPDLLARKPNTFGRFTKECPVCHGAGGSEPQYNMHTKAWYYFCVCRQCDSHGYVEPGSLDDTCIHDYREMNNGDLVCSKCNSVIYYRGD